MAPLNFTPPKENSSLNFGGEQDFYETSVLRVGRSRPSSLASRPGRVSAGASGVGDAVDVELDSRPGKQVAFAYEHRLVHPGVPPVAGFESGIDEDVLLTEGRWRVTTSDAHDRGGQLRQPEKLDIDQRSVDGLKGEPHVDSGESVLADTRPVATRADDRALSPVPDDLAPA